MGWRVRTGAAVTIVAVLLGGYLVADANDVVPGLLTLSPAPSQPAPFPSAPGAQPGPTPSPVVADLPADAPEPSPASVQNLVTAVAKDDRLGRHVGLVVADATTGRSLAGAGADAFFVPASTQKLLTGVAALAALPADRTLDTRAVLDADGRLVLVGGGDMMLGAGQGKPGAVLGRAGLDDLAAQVAGKIRVSGRQKVRLAVDDTLFSRPRIAPAVPADEAKLGYVAPVASMAVNIARLTDAEAGPRAPDPALAAAQAFAQRLKAHGITVTGDVSRTTAPEKARTVGTVRSAPLADVVAYALQHSDNTITEVLGRLVALDAGLPGSVDGSTRAVLGAVRRLGVSLDGAVLVDCSGLGRGSRLTPRQLVDVAKLTVDPDRPTLREVAVGLPVAGLSGTLSTRFTGANAGRGVVRAKTGSLPNISALSGLVVTRGERMLLFAVVADQVPTGGTVGARMIFDDFVGKLAALDAG
jgi:D-alanyl-D-alanine carboxypeptidase/D-alanyl-D-alanine-endopeptidase (penicillin-binding protein 4)